MDKRNPNQPDNLSEENRNEVNSKTEDAVDFVREFNIEDVWTTGCALNTTGKIDN